MGKKKRHDETVYPIDFVIPWVDGSDEEWIQERDLYSPDLSSKGAHDSRYRDWGTLKYWFRGIDYFAPWVHRIFFITWGHVPSWLNVKHDKLQIVNHRDYIPEKYLPTFNSDTIELNLHRIEDLSNHFVLFSDDTFIIRPTTSDDFFRDGMPRDEWVERVLVPTSKTIIDHTNINNVGIINDYFAKRKVVWNYLTKFFNLRYGKYNRMSLVSLPYERFTGFRNPHLPMSHLKSTFDILWEKEYDKLDKCCSNRFREFTDLNHWLMRYWNLCSGNFVPRSSSFGKNFNLPQDAEKAYRYIEQQKGLCVCVNDSVDVVDFDEMQAQLLKSFDSILSTTSSFEK